MQDTSQTDIFARMRLAADPVAEPANMVVCGHARFSVLTPRLIRLEWSPTGSFEDRGTFAFPGRVGPVVACATQHTDAELTLDTGALIVRYARDSGPFAPHNPVIECELDEQRQTWVPGTPNPDNLRGTRRPLDVCAGEAPLEPGLASRAGWTLLDDSAAVVFDETGWVSARPNQDVQDWYFFGYGHDYASAVSDYTRLAGRVPLIPRFVLGAGRATGPTAWTTSSSWWRILARMSCPWMCWCSTWTGTRPTAGPATLGTGSYFLTRHPFCAGRMSRACASRSTSIPLTACSLLKSAMPNLPSQWALIRLRAKRFRSASPTSAMWSTTLSCCIIRWRTKALIFGGWTGSKAAPPRSPDSIRCRGSITSISWTRAGAAVAPCCTAAGAAWAITAIPSAFRPIRMPLGQRCGFSHTSPQPPPTSAMAGGVTILAGTLVQPIRRCTRAGCSTRAQPMFAPSRAQRPAG